MAESASTASTSLLKKITPSGRLARGRSRMNDALDLAHSVNYNLDPTDRSRLNTTWDDLDETYHNLATKMQFPQYFSNPVRRDLRFFSKGTKVFWNDATNSSNKAKRVELANKAKPNIPSSNGRSFMDAVSSSDPPNWWTRQPPEIQVLELAGGVQRLRRGGFGAYGEVWKGDWTNSGEIRKVGVKFLNLRLSEGNTRTRLIRELRVWQRVDHPHILRLHGIVWNDASPIPGLVSPWMENGDLGLYLENRPDTTVLERLTLLCQVASGLRYLHDEEVVHCDLKANNILIDQEGKAYLSDFGLSRWLNGLEPLMGPCPLSSQVTGPRRWMAPEICNSEPPLTKTFATDIYAFGGLMMEVLTGHVPYHLLSDRAVVGALSDGQHPDRPQCDKPCSIGEGGRCIPVCDEHWKYMQECWSTNPESRPNATSLADQLDRFKVAQHL